jgi:alkylhydroperoxidase family enzyme
VLRWRFFPPEQIRAIVRDYHEAGLAPEDVALLEFAEKVASRADRIVLKDIEDLRRHGYGDGEILDIAIAAGARSFFSKVLDAIGAEPEETLLADDPALRQALTVGRGGQAT